MSATVVFAGAADLPWLRVEHSEIVARGEEAIDIAGPVVAVVPASRIIYRVLDMTALSPAQALAAARIDAGEGSLGAAEDRHVAVAADQRSYAIASREAMVADLAALGVAGIAPVAVVPSPSLLPPPLEGFLRAALPHETILRGPDGGFVEDEHIAPLIVGEAPVHTLTREELEAAIVDAAAAPPLNLLQGEFAPRIVWIAESGYWRRMAKFAGIALALTLLIPIAKWGKLVAATSAMDAQTAEIAAGSLGQAEATAESIATLRARLAERRGGGAGYLATQAALARAVEASPNADLGPVIFTRDGVLRATVRGTSQGDLDMVRNALIAGGFTVDIAAPSNVQGRQQAELTVRPQ